MLCIKKLSESIPLKAKNVGLGRNSMLQSGICTPQIKDLIATKTMTYTTLKVPEKFN